MVSNVVGAKQLAHLVNADIVLIVFAIRAFEQCLVFRLFFLGGEQQLPHAGNERQGTKAGFCFQLVLGKNSYLAVHFALGHLVIHR